MDSWFTSLHGFKVSDLLEYLQQGHVKSVTFMALNDYAANISIADIQYYEPIVAYYMDGNEMKFVTKALFGWCTT